MTQSAFLFSKSSRELCPNFVQTSHGFFFCLVIKTHIFRSNMVLLEDLFVIPRRPSILFRTCVPYPEVESLGLNFFLPSLFFLYPPAALCVTSPLREGEELPRSLPQYSSSSSPNTFCWSLPASLRLTSSVKMNRWTFLWLLLFLVVRVRDDLRRCLVRDRLQVHEIFSFHSSSVLLTFFSPRILSLR